MPVIVLHLPNLETKTGNRPSKCPKCGSQVLQSWGKSERQINDITREHTEVHRYRCCDCGHTFRHYPEGISRAIQSLRLRQLAALAWAIGLSSREVSEAFEKLGVSLSRMTVWREGQVLAEYLKKNNLAEAMRKYNISVEYIHGVSTKLGVVVAVDMGEEKRVALGTLDEYNPRQVQAWLEGLVQESGVQISLVRTDYLNPAYAPNPNEN